MYLNENLCYILSLDESSLPFISFPVALPCSQRFMFMFVFLGIFFAFSRWLVISTLARKKNVPTFLFFFFWQNGTTTKYYPFAGSLCDSTTSNKL